MDYNFLQYITTPDKRALALDDVRIIENGLFNISHNQSDYQDKLSFSLGKQLLSSLCGASDRQIIQNSLFELKGAIEQMKKVDIVLGFQPSSIQVEVLGKQVKRLWGENCLINPVVDSSISGGIRLTHQGKYVDLSLVKLIEDYWQSHKDYWLGRFGIN